MNMFSIAVYIHPSVSTKNTISIIMNLPVSRVQLMAQNLHSKKSSCGVWNHDEGKPILAENALEGVEQKIKSNMTTFLKYEDSLQEWFLKETSDCWEKEYIWYGSCTSFFGSEMLLEYSLKYSSSYTFCMVE